MSNRDGICCRKRPLQAKMAVFTVCACLSVEETDGKDTVVPGTRVTGGTAANSVVRFEPASRRELTAGSKGSHAQEETPARTHHRGVCVCETETVCPNIQDL